MFSLEKHIGVCQKEVDLNSESFTFGKHQNLETQ